MKQNNVFKKAKWIACEEHGEGQYVNGFRNKTECGILFRTFKINKIKRAELRYSILGFGDIYVNGKSVRGIKTSVLWSDFHTPRFAEYKYPTSGEGNHTYYYKKIDITEFMTDGAHNAIPSNVVIKGDTRSLHPQVSRLIEERMESICRHICEMNRSECKFTYTHEFAPTFNWAENVKYAAAAARAVAGEEAIPLHNSRFDYNDDILLTGAEYFAELVKQRMPK